MSCAGSCSSPEKERLKRTTELTYDKKTGKLTRLTADLNKNGKIDTWTYMNGAVPLRSEEDRDEDGKVVRTALSRRNTGKPDIRILFVASADSPHAQSWMALLNGTGRSHRRRPALDRAQ